MSEKHGLSSNEPSQEHNKLFYDTKAALQQACLYHQQGNLAQAEVIYHQILAIEPENPDALHLLGVIAYQNHNFKDGIKLIFQAIEIDSSQSSFFNSLANALKESCQYQQALETYNHAATINPQD